MSPCSVKAGKLKALAIGSDKPSPLLPDVPPLSSLKMGNMNVDMWYGVLAPAGTPRPYIERLNTELRDVLAQPAVSKAFETQGMTPAHSTPEAFRRVDGGGRQALGPTDQGPRHHRGVRIT